MRARSGLGTTALAFSFLVLFLAQAGLAQEAKDAAPPEKSSPEPAAVRLEVTVFKLEVAPDRIVELDARTLAAAGETPAALAKTLREFGATEVLYRVDQTVDGRGRGRIHVSKSTPIVSGRFEDKSGQQRTNVMREDVGARIEFAGCFVDRTDRQRVHANLSVEISAIGESNVSVQEGITSPVYWKVTQTHAGPVVLGRPIALLTVDGAVTSEGDRPVAFISLVALSEP